MKRRWRRVLLLALLVWFVIAAVLVGAAYGDVTRGRSALARARGHATTVGLQSGAADRDLKQASTLLARAHSELGFPLVQPFRLLPVAGRQLSSAIALSATGAKVTNVAVDSLTKARALSAAAKTDRQGTLVALAAVATNADNKLDHLDLGPDYALVGPLSRARREVSDDVARIRTGLARASAGANGVAALFSQPANYLVVAANNGEMRAGSGMFLSVGVLQTGDIQLRMGDMRTVSDVQAPKGSVQWPSEMQNLWGWLGSQGDFRNLMLSPRFDQSAPLATEVWDKSGKNAPVAGVIVLDPAMLQAVLAATGPVQVDGKTFNSSNVINGLLFQQYANVTGTDSQIARREGLSDVAKAAFDALNRGSWDPIVLARELAKAADGRHILMWSKDPALNAQWNQAGASGALDSNSLMCNMANIGGNKLDQFMKVDATAAQVTGRSGIDLSVTVVLTNTAPPNAPRYVQGPFPGSGLRAGEYEGALSFSVPADATGIRFDGSPKLFAAGPDGPTKVIATDVKIMPGQSKTMVLRFTRPATARVTNVGPSARIPATTWHYQGVQWLDDHTHALFH